MIRDEDLQPPCGPPPVEFECTTCISAAIVSLPSKLAPYRVALDRVVTATLVNAHTHLALSSFLGMGQSDRIPTDGKPHGRRRCALAWALTSR